MIYQCLVVVCVIDLHFMLEWYCFREREEIWLSSMTKAPTPTEKSKKQRDNIKTPSKTSITQRLRTDLGRSVWVTIITFCKCFSDAMHIIHAYRLVAVWSKFNVEKYPTINFVGGGVKSKHWKITLHVISLHVLLQINLLLCIVNSQKCYS